VLDEFLRGAQTVELRIACDSGGHEIDSERDDAVANEGFHAPDSFHGPLR